MSDWTSDYTVFDFDRPHEKVLRLTLNETQPFNTLDERGHWEVANVWKHIDADPSINVAIVTGRGKAFSAGGHFDVEEKLMAENEYRIATFKEARDLVYNIINCNKPIVSAINGVAVGAGLVAALLADISIAGKAAKIVDGHTRLGVAAGDCAVINWPLLCGMAKAKYLLMLCEPVDGEAKMLHFLATIVELSSDTSHSASNDSNNGRTMLYRSEIDNHGTDISPLCHFSADNCCTGDRCACPYP